MPLVSGHFAFIDDAINRLPGGLGEPSKSLTSRGWRVKGAGYRRYRSSEDQTAAFSGIPPAPAAGEEYRLLPR